MAPDKKGHFIAGFSITTIIIIFSMLFGASYESITSYSVAALFIVGAIKEGYDYISTRWFGKNHTAEAGDIFWTVLGAMPYFIGGVLWQLS